MGHGVELELWVECHCRLPTDPSAAISIFIFYFFTNLKFCIKEGHDIVFNPADDIC